MRQRREIKSSGFSLLELIITLVLILLLCAFVTSVFYDRDKSEALIAEAAQRVRLRRAAAMQLSAGVGGASAIDRLASQPPVRIDLADSSTTRELILRGANASQLQCPETHPLSRSGWCEKINMDGSRERVRGTWDYQYLGKALAITAISAVPDGVRPIAGAQLTTSLEFLANGRLTSPDPNAIGEAVNWVIYFRNNTKVRALLVSEDGFVEICRWEDGKWTGFEERDLP